MGSRTYNQDAELIFHDGAAAVTADGAGQVASAARIHDVGQARFEAVMLVDVTALDIVSNDERYIVLVQGSSSPTFASNIENLVAIELGATEVRAGGAKDSTVGRYELPFCNEQDNEIYRYLRVYVDVAGTTPSLTFKAWASTKY